MTGVNGPVEDLTGRRLVVVTGASSGIGLAAAVELARRGDQVVLVGRDPARLQRRRRSGTGGRRRASGAVPGRLRRRSTTCADWPSSCATAYDRIDVLANNAGAIVLQPITTVDGFELTIQANHLAPFLLTQPAAPTGSGRIVITASGAHRCGALDPDDLNAPLRRLPADAARTAPASRRTSCSPPRRPGAGRTMPAYCFHPGVVRTRFAQRQPAGRVRHAVHAVPQPGEGRRDPGLAGQPGPRPG